MTSPVLTVWRKEVTENFRDRRTLFSALLFGPLFGPFLLALMINLMLEKTVTQADQKVRVAVTASERAPNLVRFLEEHDIVVVPATLDLAQCFTRFHQESLSARGRGGGRGREGKK